MRGDASVRCLSCGLAPAPSPSARAPVPRVESPLGARFFHSDKLEKSRLFLLLRGGRRGLEILGEVTQDDFIERLVADEILSEDRVAPLRPGLEAPLRGWPRRRRPSGGDT